MHDIQKARNHDTARSGLGELFNRILGSLIRREHPGSKQSERPP
jgi:hypothetical protein